MLSSFLTEIKNSNNVDYQFIFHPIYEPWSYWLKVRKQTVVGIAMKRAIVTDQLNQLKRIL